MTDTRTDEEIKAQIKRELIQDQIRRQMTTIDLWFFYEQYPNDMFLLDTVYTRDQGALVAYSDIYRRLVTTVRVQPVHGPVSHVFEIDWN